MSYTISGKSITCHKCGLTSHNYNDVVNLYCGRCHTFHDEAIDEDEPETFAGHILHDYEPPHN